MNWQSEDGTVGLFDYEAIAKLFDRSGANTLATKTIAENGTVNDLMAAQAQVAIVAAMHRDYSALRRSRIRTFVHEGVRAEGDGDASGALAMNTIGWIGRSMT